jgi:zinc protease
LERERAVIIERIKNRDDNPAGVSFELFCENLYPKHPYGMRSAGTEESLARLTTHDVENYHRNIFSPDQLVVCVVGPFDEDVVMAMLSEHLSHPGDHKPLVAPQRDGPLTAARVVRRVLDKKQSHIVIGGMGTTLDDRERHALEVLTTILSGQSGRLFTDLRDKQSLAYSVSSSNLEGLDPGHLLIHMGTSPDKEEQAKEGIYRHIALMRDEQVSHDELERAQRYLVGNHAIDLQRGGSRGMTMALHTLFGMAFDEHTRYGDAVKSVTRKQVQQAARKYWDPNRLLEVVVGPNA